MPTPTYDLIASTVLSSTATIIEFTSIPATYRDLVLRIHATSNNSIAAFIRFNGDTGNNYSRVGMRGNGTTVLSISANTYSWIQTDTNLTSGSGNYGLQTLHIMDYSATDKHKTVLLRLDNAAFTTNAIAARWANTSAITSLSVNGEGLSYGVGTSVQLYGIVS